MKRFPILRAAALTAPLLLAGGCTSLGGNVKGSFACRAPEGSCAPTSTIDAGATGIDDVQVQAGHRPGPEMAEAGRRLQIVLAAYRDEAGRDHEARVVHVTLPERPETGWRMPRGRREVLRSLAATISGAREAGPASDIHPTEPHTAETLPEQLFIPSQPVPAMPGADAPDTGGPGSFSSPREPVPHPDASEGGSE